MRIVFCGSAAFAIPTLRALIAARHEVAKVVTQPPRPAGRGGRLRPTPLAEAAGELHLPVVPVENINAPEIVEALGALGAEVMLVAAFGQMIRRPVRDLFVHGAINLHCSLLPELRGAAPANWAIIRGYARTGVTTFRLVDRMDAGPILLQEATDVRPDETAEELLARLAEAGAGAMLRTLEALSAGSCPGLEQDDSQATPAPRLQKSDGAIDFAADAVTIRNLIHGTWPWPGGQARYVGPGAKETDVIVARARGHEGEPGAEPGNVRPDLTLAAGRGRVEILQIKPAGGRLMSWRDFVNGYRVRPGTRFVPVAR